MQFFAQNKKTDSLFTELNKWKNKIGIAADTNLYNVYYNLGVSFQKSNPDTAFYYLGKSIDYAKRQNDKILEAKSITQQGQCFYIKSDYSKANQYYLRAIAISEEQIEKANKKIKAKEVQSNAIGYIGSVYFSQGSYDKALDNFFKALKISQEIQIEINQAHYLGSIGSVFYQKGNFDTALDYYLKSLKIHEKIGFKKGIASSYGNIGNIYSELGNYNKALDYNYKALKIKEEIGEKYAQNYNLENIGSIYACQEDNVRALEYFLKSLKICEAVGDKQGQASNYGNIATIFTKKNELTKAFEYYFKALKIYEEIEDIQGQSIIFGNIGGVYTLKGEFIKALDYFLKAKKIDEDNGNKQGQVINLGNIGSLYLKLKKYDDAYRYTQQAIHIGEDLNIIFDLKNIYKNLSDLYAHTNKHKEALEAYKKYISCRDSVMSKENQKASVQKEMQFEFDKKEALQKAEQDKKDILTKEELKKQTLQRNGFIIGFGLMLLLTGVVFRSYRNKQKANKIISEQKTIVEQQKHVIEERHKEITDSINYAERIQRSFLATKEMLDSNLIRHSKSNNYTTPNSHAELVSASEQIPKQIQNDDNDYFIFFKPKDVVSGDFYWAANIVSSSVVENFAIVTADSTGHGVPGAIMSLLNITSLEKAIETNTQPHNILNATRKIIIERLKKDGSEEGGKDGMDCSLLVFDFKNKKLQIAAANNPVWIVRNPVTSSEVEKQAGLDCARPDISKKNTRPDNTKEIIEIKPDKMPVGKHDKQNIPFTLHEIQLQKGDVIYTLTDGFSD
ncbi:MAG: tetratricopeptide repeat protein, partial [Bacteroidetes bacterium]|nr:tetratricopeptide repeat protein [Bacteroidota bacterium]